jgi:hypothetical protein
MENRSIRAGNGPPAAFDGKIKMKKAEKRKLEKNEKKKTKEEAAFSQPLPLALP